MALKRDGTVWSWGDNYPGQLGGDTITSNTTPVQVSGLSDIISIATGFYHTVALKSDGTVWAWGWNWYGQLGDGTSSVIDFRTTPVQVTGLTDVVSVAAGSLHTVTLKSDGTVWTWGYNAVGQLGDGSNIDRTAPVQVTGLSTTVSIAALDAHTVALNRDGAVWTWGYNAYGQLGDGTTTDRTAPVQVL